MMAASRLPVSQHLLLRRFRRLHSNKRGQRPFLARVMNHWLRRGLLAGLFIMPALSGAQVTGGQHAFEFLRLPQSPHISALGGINVSNPSLDVSLGLQNPALMRPALHNQLSLAYNNFYSGISIANLAY